jgi:hypothetical protein
MWELGPIELAAMRHAAQVVARWQREYRDEPDHARRLVLEVMVLSDGPWRDAYLTAFGK